MSLAASSSPTGISSSTAAPMRCIQLPCRASFVASRAVTARTVPTLPISPGCRPHTHALAPLTSRPNTIAATSRPMQNRYASGASRTMSRAGVSRTVSITTAETPNHSSWRVKFCCTVSFKNSRAGPCVAE